MIEIQLTLRELLAAILAGVVIPQKNIVPCELHLLGGEFVIDRQNNHLRNTHGKIHRAHNGFRHLIS